MIYESRTYLLQPGTVPAYLAMFAGDPAVQQLIAPHLVGFWVAEGGALNTVHHLWKYEDREARALARTSLATQPAMQGLFAKAGPLLHRQSSTLLWGDVVAPGSPSTPGVFDRVSIAPRPGIDGDAIVRQLSQILADCFQPVATLNRRMFEHVGPNVECLLVLRSDSLQQRDECWSKVVPSLAGIDLLATVHCSTQLLLSTSFSPWR